MTVNLTPYPDVNAVLRDLRAGVTAALGEHLVGMYLFGSLASGDFDPRRSDVDVLIVTDGLVSTEQFDALAAIHRDLAASDSAWATEVEAYYLTRAALRRGDPSFGEHLKVNRGNAGTLEPLHPDSGWLIQGHIFREHGVALVGPAPRTLVDPIAPGDLRRTMAASAVEWLEPLLNDSHELHRRGPRTYVVLTLCRILYTVANDAVASKPVAGRYALATLPNQWHGLIERALAWRKDEPATEGELTSHDDVAATVELIRHVLARCRAER
jgi:predicted nucleotidyltransferase